MDDSSQRAASRSPHLLAAHLLAACCFLPMLAGAAAAQESQCADCHFAHPSPAWAHLSNWEISAHGRQDVGCESCHGGNARTWNVSEAHRGILSGVNPASPTHIANLPRTCGSCHTEQFAAFETSRHAALLAEGDLQAPNCSTCHTDAGAYLLSSRGLRRACQRCHGEGKRAPATGRAELAQDLHLQVRAVRELSDSAGRIVRRVRDQERGAALQLELARAVEPLTEAVQVAHSFSFDRFEELVAESRRRHEALLERLANR